MGIGGRLRAPREGTQQSRAPIRPPSLTLVPLPPFTNNRGAGGVPNHFPTPSRPLRGVHPTPNNRAYSWSNGVVDLRLACTTIRFVICNNSDRTGQAVSARIGFNRPHYPKAVIQILGNVPAQQAAIGQKRNFDSGSNATIAIDELAPYRLDTNLRISAPNNPLPELSPVAAVTIHRAVSTTVATSSLTLFQRLTILGYIEGGFQGETFNLAVTGGTGKFKNAKGSVQFTRLSVFNGSGANSFRIHLPKPKSKGDDGDFDDDDDDKHGHGAHGRPSDDHYHGSHRSRSRGHSY